MAALKRWLIAAAAAAGVAATVSLGSWQWGRAQEKLALEAAIARKAALPALTSLSPLRDAAALQELVHRPVVLRGEWAAAHTVFLENRQMLGKPGFYVVTPLRLEGDGTVVLVQRGWVQRDFNDRTRLPPILTAAGPVEVRGRLAPPPAQLYALGAESRGPIRQNLDLAAFRAETGLALLPASVQQTGPASEGLLRDWPQPASGAGKNYGYAAQWWALAALILVLYVWFLFVAPSRQRRRA